jgi:hypothetical protein
MGAPEWSASNGRSKVRPLHENEKASDLSYRFEPTGEQFAEKDKGDSSGAEEGPLP